MRDNARIRRRRSNAATAILVLGAVLAGAALWAIPATARDRSRPGAGTSEPAAATAPAVPTFVHLPADQARTCLRNGVRGRPPQRPWPPVRLRGAATL